jgi:hypothetical protein
MGTRRACRSALRSRPRTTPTTASKVLRSPAMTSLLRPWIAALVLAGLPTAAWAGPTVRLPDGVEAAAWRDVLAQAGLEVATSRPADVHIYARGATWTVTVGPAAAPLRTATVPAPTSEDERAAVGWLVASLTESLISERAAPSAVHDPAPAARGVVTVATVAPAATPQRDRQSVTQPSAPLAAPANRSATGPRSDRDAQDVLPTATPDAPSPPGRPADDDAGSAALAQAPVVSDLTDAGLRADLSGGAGGSVQVGTLSTGDAPTTEPPEAAAAITPAEGSADGAPPERVVRSGSSLLGGAAAAGADDSAATEPALPEAIPAAPTRRPVSVAPSVWAAGGVALHLGSPVGGRGSLALGVVLADHARVSMTASVAGPRLPSAVLSATGTTEWELGARADWSPPWRVRPELGLGAGAVHQRFEQDEVLLAQRWTPFLAGRLAVVARLPPGLWVGAEARVAGDFRAITLAADDGDSRWSPVRAFTGLVLGWQPTRREKVGRE